MSEGAKLGQVALKLLVSGLISLLIAVAVRIFDIARIRSVLRCFRSD